MGRHVNHQDVQDKLISRNLIISKLSGSLEDKDIATLSIIQQEKLFKQRFKDKFNSTSTASRAPTTRFSSKKY